jgi:hypothetical protein
VLIEDFNMKKSVAICQSNYIPWKGYFDLINLVDEFVIYDDMQYTKRDWRNRNKIKTRNGLKWITIPVRVKGKYFQKILDTEISDPNWAKKHWVIIKSNYSKAKYFKNYCDRFENLYLNNKDNKLSSINYKFITTICKILEINTNITWSSEYDLIGDKTEKLVGICMQLNAYEYLSGPAAKSYLSEKLFFKNNIKVKFIDYKNYKEYHQLFPPFEHAVSVIDLIFNEGPNAKMFLKSI